MTLLPDRSVALLLLGCLGAAAVLAGFCARALPEAAEHATLNWRSAIRADRPAPASIAIVAIDGRTTAATNHRYPLSRYDQAAVVRWLTASGARVLAYDLVLNGVSDDPDADIALVRALRRAPRPVVAVTRYDQAGRPDLLAGIEPFERSRATPGNALRLGQRSGTWIGFTPQVGALQSFPVAVAQAFTGQDVRTPARALIDYRGPSGTFPRISFIDVLDRKVPASVVRGKVVVVGPTASDAQDLHDVPGGRMSGVELQANAIATAIDGFPLRRATGSTTSWMILGLGLVWPALLACVALLRRRDGATPLPRAAVALGAAGLALGWLVAAQLLFAHGTAVALVPTCAAALVAAGGSVSISRRLARRRLQHRFAAGDVALVDEVMATDPGVGELGRLRSHIPGYALHARVGKGAMGIVYRATQLKLNRPVAIKLIHPRWADVPLYRERFLQEAQKAAAVTHPHLVTVHTIDLAGTWLYLVMAYIDGVTLRRTLNERGHLPLGVAAEVLYRVAEAVDALGKRNVVHCDIKPENILHTKDELEHPYLTDFGIAWVPELEELSRGAGTPPYMAPEQIRGEQPTPATDIYALGVVLFECVTGTLPFDGSPEDIAFAPRPAASERHPGVPPQLDGVLQRAMAIEPAERYETAVEFLQDVLEVARDWPDTQDPEDWRGSGAGSPTLP